MRSALQNLEDRVRAHTGLAVAALAAILLLLCFLPLLARVAAYACSVDLAIYAQAIHAMGRGEINPFVPVRNVSIFADHVDPIIFLLAPFTWIFPARYVLVTAEFTLVLAAVAPLLVAFRRGMLTWDWLLWAAAFLWFSPATIHALSMPVHPATWSVLPVVLLGLAIHHNRTGPIVAALLFLFTFREEFPLWGLSLGAFWLWRGPRRRGAVVLALSLTAAFLVLWVRPRVLSDSVDYGDTVLRHVFHPGLLWDIYSGDSHHFFLIARYIAPFLPWAWVLWKQRHSPSLALLALVVPGFLIRVFRPAMDSHYMPVMVAAVMMALLPVGRGVAVSLPRWMPALTLCLMFPLSGHYLEKNLEALRGGPAELPNTAERLQSLARGFALLQQHPDGAVLTAHNLVAGLEGHPMVQHLGGPQRPNSRTYQYVMVEKAPYGDPWPLGRERLNALEAQWRADPGITILQDDAYVFVARGTFAQDR